MSYFLSPDTVLLGHESQCDKVGGLEVAFSGCGGKDDTAATEVSFFKVEQGALLFVFRLFTRAEEEE